MSSLKSRYNVPTAHKLLAFIRLAVDHATSLSPPADASVWPPSSPWPPTLSTLQEFNAYYYDFLTPHKNDDDMWASLYATAQDLKKSIRRWCRPHGEEKDPERAIKYAEIVNPSSAPAAKRPRLAAPPNQLSALPPPISASSTPPPAIPSSTPPLSSPSSSPPSPRVEPGYDESTLTRDDKGKVLRTADNGGLTQLVLKEKYVFIGGNHCTECRRSSRPCWIDEWEPSFCRRCYEKYVRDNGPSYFYPKLNPQRHLWREDDAFRDDLLRPHLHYVELERSEKAMNLMRQVGELRRQLAALSLRPRWTTKTRSSSD